MGKHLTLIALFLLTFNGLLAQKGNNSTLKIKDIMQGDDFVGHLPSNHYWSTNGSTLYFDWNPDGAMSDSLYAYSIAKKDINKVDFLSAHALPSSRIVYNKQKNKAVYTKNGDIFLLDVASYKAIPVTNTQAWQCNPHFTHNGKVIAYTQVNELFVWDMYSGTT